jgi:tetratricopeptide (TPR) repeat protein
MKKFFQHLPWFFALGCFLILCGGCSKAAKARRLLSSANKDYQAQQFDSAEIKYRGVLRLSYLNPVAIRQLGLLYYAEGRPADAYPFLEKSTQQNPANIEVRVRLAQSMTSLGQAKNAETLTLQVLQKAPENEDALLLLVDLARSPAELAAARRQIEQLPAAPDSAAHYAALGWADLRLRKTNDAEVEIQQAIKLNPKLAPAYLAMSAIAAERRDARGASNYLATAAQLSPVRSATRIKYADFLFESGARAEAQQTIEDITHQAPDYVPALINLMHLFFAERDYTRCLDIAGRILGRDPRNFEALMESGDVSLAKRDAAAAVETFKRVDSNLNSVHKSFPLVKYRLAVAYLMKGEPANAVASLNEALSVDHNFAPATLLLGELDIRNGNSTAAIDLLAPLVKKAPQEARAHLLLATAYLALRRPDDALGVYREMAKVFPKNPEVPRLMGVVYEQESNATQARKFYEQSLALSPDYMPTLRMITGLDVSTKHYADAENRLSAVISKNPKSADTWLLQGQVYWVAGQTNRAESSMAKAIDLDPNISGAYLALARLYVQSHQLPQALARLEALVSKTNNIAAMLEIGELHEEAKQMDEARDAFEKLLAVEPSFVPALNNLAYLYSEHYGNLQKAVELASRAHELRPDDPFVADTLGWILYQQGQYSHALSLLQESLEKEPGSAEVQMHLGMVFYMLEDEDVARLHLQQALSSREDYPGKAEARQCFDLLAIDPATVTPAQRELLKTRLHDNPHDPVPLTRLAAIDELHGETDDAAQAYQKLVAENPQDWKAMIKLSQLYSGPLHDTRKALDLAKSAHEIAPADPRVAATLGELVYTSGDYSWAVSLLEGAAPQLPNQTTVHYYLALAYYAVGRLADADATMTDIANAGPSQPDYVQAKQFLAYRAAAKNPAHSAISTAEVHTALEKDSHYLPALMLSGLLSEQQGDYKQAGQTYEQILTDYPKFTPAMRQLALVYAWHSGDEARAYELGDKARVAFPDDSELARTLGILAYRKAEYQRSAQLLNGVSRQFNNDGELLYYLGMDYYQLRRTEDSKQTLRRALALNVPSPMAGQAKKVLGELK